MRNVLILSLCSVFELLKRPIFWFIYPVAYYFKLWARESKSVCARILYYALDDSIRDENLRDHGVAWEYCHDENKRSKFVEKWLPYNWARSFYWGSFRNNAINLMILTEQWIGSKVETISHKQFKNPKSFYEVRLFSSGFKLPYLGYWIGGWRLQIGFISCGRWQISCIMKE